jgi:hypothetical protein
MATFSNAPAAAANTLSTTSSLSYHHLLSTSNGSNNNNNNNSSNSTSSDENITTINDVNINNAFDTNTSYLNNADFSLCLSTNQQTNPFDVVVSTSTSPPHFNNDPLVRHLFNYRQNDPNFTGNYYSNMSTGSFVNAFDYSYTNMAPTGLASDAAVPNHGFTSTLTSNNPQQHHPHPHPSFVNSYIPYPHPQQQLLKQADSFSVPIQQQQQHQVNQQQNIYPWMRRIHNNCGKFFNVLLKFEEKKKDMKFNSFPSFSDSLLFFCLYSNIDVFTIYTQSFLWAIYVVLLRVRGDLWARSGRDE